MSVHVLPPGLPEPVDDGACDHLEGRPMPGLVLDSSQGPVDLATLGTGLAVLYVYPRTGKPDVPVPDAWDAIPGARGCTPQSCGFRDLHAEIAATGARVVGLSTQPPEEQRERVERLHLPFPLISDPELRLHDALGLPTFEFGDRGELYKRVTLVAHDGVIEKVFYPVFPPDRNAADVLNFLRSSAST